MKHFHIKYISGNYAKTIDKRQQIILKSIILIPVSLLNKRLLFTIIFKMANKNRKTRQPSRKSTRKPTAVVPKKRRPRRSTKATQVTGPEIDDAFEDLVNKTVLERNIKKTVTEDEEKPSSILIATHYEDSSPFDPDEDLDDEPNNRKKMYEVPPKVRSPEGGGASAEVMDANDSQSMPTTAANQAYEVYFN